METNRRKNTSPSKGSPDNSYKMGSGFQTSSSSKSTNSSGTSGFKSKKIVKSKFALTSNFSVPYKQKPLTNEDIKNKLAKSIDEMNKMYSKIEQKENLYALQTTPLDEIETEWDEVLVIDGDCFKSKQKEVKFKIVSYATTSATQNVAIVNEFPNALLLEDGIFTESETTPGLKQKESKSDTMTDTMETTDAMTDTMDTTTDINTDSMFDTVDNIWDFVEKVKKESQFESIDDIIQTNDSEEQSEDGMWDGETNRILCKSCGGKNSMIEDTNGTLVCRDCGIVNEDLLDYSPEWRQYNNDDSRGDGISRCACPTNYFFPKSSQGTIMSGSNYNRLKRKQKWNSMVYKERSLNHVLEHIVDICTKNGIQKIIIDSAKIMYKKLSDCKHKTGPNKGKSVIIRGHNRHSIIAACVFFSCVMNHNPRGIKEMATMFSLPITRITKGCKQLFKLMKNSDDNYFFEQLDASTPEHHIQRFCPKLKINKADTDLAVKIAKNCSKINVASDHNPHSIAAGSIMLMVEYRNLAVEKKQIAELFKTSEVTITKICNKIYPYLDALIDDDATNHLVKKFNLGSS